MSSARRLKVRHSSSRLKSKRKPPQDLVCVIDDDPSVRRSVARLLRSAGYRVELLDSAEKFLQGKPSRSLGCLVLDLRMPGLNGLELQRALIQADQRIPIVFISGQGNIPTSVQAIKEGAVDFLPKPFDDSELLAAVRQALAKGRIVRKEQNQQRNAQGRAQRLTEREREVLEFVIAGRLNKQIATFLGISEKTVKVHRGRVMEKTGVASVADLVRFTVTAGIQPSRC